MLFVIDPLGELESIKALHAFLVAREAGQMKRSFGAYEVFPGGSSWMRIARRPTMFLEIYHRELDLEDLATQQQAAAKIAASTHKQPAWTRKMKKLRDNPREVRGVLRESRCFATLDMRFEVDGYE